MSDLTKKHYDDDEIVRSGEGRGQEFAHIATQMLSRRAMLRLGAVAGFFVAGGSALAKVAQSTEASSHGLDFLPISPSTSTQLSLAQNYRQNRVVSWGDPLKAGMPAFDPARLNPTWQANSAGYNFDFVGYLPLPYGSDNSEHGLLSINNEYINPELMFPIKEAKDVTMAQALTCIEAVGNTVVEIKKGAGGDWEMVQDSKYNRRWTGSSPMRISGPAAGSPRMKTSDHPTGTTARGTFSNCSGGKTPWGTILSGEENFQSMFTGAKAYKSEEDKRSAQRYGLSDAASEYRWEKYDDRFDIAKEPNEPYHFGWVVEIDPYDPDWTPVKRTSLGRFRHEAATVHITKGGKVVMYSGDDALFEYVYKFVCKGEMNKADRKANRNLLDEGTLYVAKYNEDGTGEWLPLVFGQGPLTPANGFNSQADVMIDVRIAADLLGATKMDRPEDIEVNPVTEKVYVVCTNNSARGKEGQAAPDKMNPRPENRHGHIVEMIEAGNDHAATRFTWDLFMVCGDPGDEATYFAGYPKDKLSPISCPDNICFDRFGNLWIATDGMEKSMKLRDGFFAVPTEGPERGHLKQLFASVPGSEVCGPEFTPDGKTAFLAIQHPGEGSTYENPTTSWPGESGPPRPSIIAIQAKNGKPIGDRGA